MMASIVFSFKKSQINLQVDLQSTIKIALCVLLQSNFLRNKNNRNEHFYHVSLAQRHSPIKLHTIHAWLPVAAATTTTNE